MWLKLRDGFLNLSLVAAVDFGVGDDNGQAQATVELIGGYGTTLYYSGDSVQALRDALSNLAVGGDEPVVVSR